MQITENEITRKYGKQCRHCNRNTLLFFENERICFVCGYDLIRRKRELSKNQQKKFIDRLKYAEHKILRICKEVYQNYEGIDFEKIYEV